MTQPTRADFTNAPVVVTMKDGTKQPATFTGGGTLTLTTPTPVKTTRFGVDPSRSTATDFAADIRDFPGALVGAAYGGAGEGILPWTSPWVAPMVKAGYRITHSAKDFNLAPYVASWDTMPAGDLVHQYIPFHEANRPSGGPDFATWAAFWKTLVKARDAHKNAARIELGPNFSWWPAQIAKNEGTAWQKFVLPGADFISWDQYWASGMGTYADLDLFTQLPEQSGIDCAVPVDIREFGVSGKIPDATAARVITEIAPIYQAKGFQSVSYFQYRSGVSGAWLTKTARPLAFAAWQHVCAGQ